MSGPDPTASSPRTAEDVIADGRLSHGPAHLGVGRGNGVAAEIDRLHGAWEDRRTQTAGFGIQGKDSGGRPDVLRQ